MKICSLSDIHGSFIDIPECDVLCIAGDIVDLNNQRSIDASRHWWYNRFTNWVNRLPCKKVIITPGNHDFFLEDAYNKGYYNELKQDLSVRTNGKLVILIDEQYTYEGIKFYGCPYIRPISFQKSRWAFEDKGVNVGEIDPDTGEENTSDEVITHYNKIPNDIDILITHDSPFKNKLLGNVAKHKIAHFYGHWHEGPELRKSGYYNCSLLTDMYNNKDNYEPIIIDTEEQVIEEDDIPWETNLNTEENELITEDLQ